jgi:hypothetical protein
VSGGHEAAGSSDRDRGTAALRRAEPLLTLVVATSSATVAVAKDRPASTIGILAAAVALAFLGLRAIWRAKRADGGSRFPKLRVGAVVLAVAVLAGVAGAAALPASRRVLVHDLLGFVDRSGRVSVEALTIGEVTDGYQLVIALHNTSEEEQLLESLLIRATTSRLVLARCTGTESSPVEVQDHLTVTAAKSDRLELSGSATIGAGEATVRIHGKVFNSCLTGDSWLELAIPTTVQLAPKAYTIVHVNVPTKLALRTAPSPPDDTSRPTVAAIRLPLDGDQGGILSSSAVEVVASASGGLVASYRQGNRRGPIGGG